MRNRSLLYLAAVLLPLTALLFGCGGGAKEEEAEAPPPPAGTAATSTAAAPAGAPAAAGGATLTAKIVLDGKAPEPQKIDMAADKYCEQAHKNKPGYTQDIEANANGTLKDVFVFVKDGANGTYTAPTTPVVLDQIDCHYVPHCLAVMAGQPVEIENSDATLHNIHPLPVVNTAFNIGMPFKGMTQTKVFEKPEAPFHVKCDVHKWMSAWIGVFANPFFGVSNDQGVVAIKNLPPGTYTIEAWQEKYGPQTQSVTITGSQPQEITFTYKAS
jgi:plastocyanin